MAMRGRCTSQPIGRLCGDWHSDSGRLDHRPLWATVQIPSRAVRTPLSGSFFNAAPALGGCQPRVGTLAGARQSRKNTYIMPVAGSHSRCRVGKLVLASDKLTAGVSLGYAFRWSCAANRTAIESVACARRLDPDKRKCCTEELGK
jgi:hypothetical protein